MQFFTINLKRPGSVTSLGAEGPCIWQERARFIYSACQWKSDIYYADTKRLLQQCESMYKTCVHHFPPETTIRNTVFRSFESWMWRSEILKVWWWPLSWDSYGRKSRRFLHESWQKECSFTRATLQSISPQCCWLPSRNFNSSNTLTIHLIWHPEITTSSTKWRMSLLIMTTLSLLSGDPQIYSSKFSKPDTFFFKQWIKHPIFCKHVHIKSLSVVSFS